MFGPSEEGSNVVGLQRAGLGQGRPRTRPISGKAALSTQETRRRRRGPGTGVPAGTSPLVAAAAGGGFGKTDGEGGGTTGDGAGAGRPVLGPGSRSKSTSSKEQQIGGILVPTCGGRRGGAITMYLSLGYPPAIAIAARAAANQTPFLLVTLEKGFEWWAFAVTTEAQARDKDG